MTNYEYSQNYFRRLMGISFLGYLYNRFFKAPILFILMRRFGSRHLEVGSGIGSGVLGAFPSYVEGLEINPLAVEFCQQKGFTVGLIKNDGRFPNNDGAFDSVLMDNVLEHISNPELTLSECWRVTKSDGGLFVVVPGIAGFKHDSDHKIFYDANQLESLDKRWRLQCLFSLPFGLKSKRISFFVRQYCLVAVYKKAPDL